uniref:Leucine-rich repeat-containing N-terminal plant-type domain-containing protein n=1 Tax=Fagus sylvatica TaxID=28930 RepID=A0A2N9HQF0_FAGSY
MGLSHLSSAFCMHTFILLCCFGLFVTSVVGGNNETDRLALLAFKAKITHDPLRVMNSWNDSIHFCQWQGVTCGRRHQRVIVLDLQSRKLGEIPSNLSGCNNLIALSVGSNQLVGEIPTTLSLLDKAQILWKSDQLGGPSNVEQYIISFDRVKFRTENHLQGNIPLSLVAVKVLNLLRRGASKSFMAECEALRNIRHRNLVKEMANLDEWLHPTPRTNEALEEPKKLSLLQRLNIAIDVTSAWQDFFMMLPKDCSTNQSSSIGVRGTVGYTPPEYGMGNEVSIYGDVYSYGILLLRDALPERIIDIVDPILLWEIQEEETRMNDTRPMRIRMEVPKFKNA